MESIHKESVSLPTIRRLPSYLRIVRQAEQDGMIVISAKEIAGELDLEPIQVRKDLSFTGAVGKPRIGYLVKNLVTSLESFLRWDVSHNSIVIGTGNLGLALLGHMDFRKNGLNIIAAFDQDPIKIGEKFYGIPVSSMDKLDSIIQEHQIQMAILTVPAYTAQDICNQVVSFGVRRIWNFADIKLKVPTGFSDVIIQQEDLLYGYAVLCVF